MTVHPLALGLVAREPDHLEHLTTGRLVAIQAGRRVKPTDASGASDGVQAESPDARGVVAVDGETRGEGHAEAVVADVVHVANIGPLASLVKGPGPVPRLSHPIHVIVEFGIILLFGLKMPTVDDTWERFLLKHRRSNFYVLFVVTHLNQLSNIGIVNLHQLLIHFEGD